MLLNVKLFEYSKYSIKELSEKIGYEDIVKYKVLINEIKFASDVEWEKSKCFLDNESKK